jgi:lysophospholipase L1-like esterase
MNHIVLLGDSIFDNASYVPTGTEVEAQLRSRLGEQYQVQLLARDGSVLEDMAAQVACLGDFVQASNRLVVSCGGNDVLGLVGHLHSPVRSALNATELLASWQTRFQSNYQRMLDLVLSKEIPTAVSTIYDAMPGLAPGVRAMLALFNDVILREAAVRRLPVLDLRLVCTEATDYSSSSLIEPSANGSRKIAAAIEELVRAHDPADRRTVMYGAGQR